MKYSSLAFIITGNFNNKYRGPYLRLNEFLSHLNLDDFNNCDIDVYIPSIINRKSNFYYKNKNINVIQISPKIIDFYFFFKFLIFNQLPLQSIIYFRNELVNALKKYDKIHLITSRVYLNVKGKYENKTSIDFIDSLALNMNRYKRVSKNFLMKFLYKFEANRMKKFEKEISYNINNSIIISKFDRNFINRNIEIIEGFCHVPDKIETNYPNKINKKYFCFSGNLKYKSNITAIKFFINEIYPHLEKEIKDSFYIIGKTPSSNFDKFIKKNDIKFLYDVKNIYPFLRDAHFTIAPMKDGSGQNKLLTLLH